MENKNVLIVSSYFYPEGGGLEMYAFKTADYLCKKNKVIVICATKKETKSEDHGFKIIRRHPNFFVSNTPIVFGFKKEIETMAKLQKIDFIIAHTPVPYCADIASMVAKKYKIPLVLHYHSSSLYKKKLIDIIAFLYENLFEKKLFDTAKKIILASYYPVDKKFTKYKGKTLVITPFIDLDKFKPGKTTRKDILFVGQLDKSHRWKGLNNLLEAFSTFHKKNPDYRLVIVGDGNYKEYYQKKSKKFGVEEKVIFTGKLKQNELISFYQNCYFVVIPSISDVEGTPTVLFESMACGKPIIGGNVGGITYILEKEKCGIIVNAKRSDELAKTMNSLANNKELYRELSESCIENIKKYDSTIRLKELEKIYESAVEKNPPRKIAVFHNFMDNIGGAEIVALTLARGLNADIYTTNIDPEKIKKMGFEDIIPRIKSLGKIPINAPFRHQMAFYKFRKLNLRRKYDFYIIAGDWAMSGAVNNKPNLWYAHSPLNELWEFKSYIKKNLLSWWQKPLFDIWVFFNRNLTKKYSKHIGVWACNSKNTQKRIKKYYKKNAVIINPPTETKNFYYNKNGYFWLSVNRLTKAKRINIQLDTFKHIPEETLVIIGSYEKGARQSESEKSEIEKTISKNVTIKNWVSKKELIDLYANCKGFITTSMDEDFGLNAIEAMASGKPVIAPNEGGYKETIINGVTGILIDNIDENKLVEAIKNLGKKIEQNPLEFKNACQEQAKKFDTEIFIKKIKDAIKNARAVS